MIRLLGGWTTRPPHSSRKLFGPSFSCRMSSMKSSGLIRSSSAGLSRSGLLALLLVGALLLCYGAFGALHQLSDVDIPMVEHSSSTEKGATGGHSEGHQGWHLGSMDCAAALLVVFLGAVVGLLSRSTRTWSRVAAFSLTERCFPQVVLHPPRGPTASLLQVFRL
jgi:hypothetical protein